MRQILLFRVQELSTLAELTALGVPAILIPSPYVAANHQEYNARELENNHAAKMILEKI